MNSNRSRKAKVTEFLIWAAVAIATAVIMVALSEKLLPANF
jgi:hypothetical protein